jgi:hypothetical protein
MKTILAATVIAASFAPLSALAQERVGDAALGALSGAVVLGPVGAVAGAVVGYTAGPAIARSWGLNRSEPRYQRRPARRSAARGASNQVTAHQGAFAQGAVTKGAAKDMPPARSPAQSTDATQAVAPVQGLE